MSLKMAAKLEQRFWSIALGIATFVAIAILRLPLLHVLAVGLPGGLLLAYLSRAKA
jgi:hypothetical protein